MYMTSDQTIKRRCRQRERTTKSIILAALYVLATILISHFQFTASFDARRSRSPRCAFVGQPTRQRRNDQCQQQIGLGGSILLGRRRHIRRDTIRAPRQNAVSTTTPTDVTQANATHNNDVPEKKRRTNSDVALNSNELNHSNATEHKDNFEVSTRKKIMLKIEAARGKVKAATANYTSAVSSNSTDIKSGTINSISQTPAVLTQEECDNLLALCVANDEWDFVLDVLDLMKQQNLQQVKSTYRQCLQACFETANAQSSIEILNAMKQALPSGNMKDASSKLSSSSLETDGGGPDATDVALTVATMCRSEKTEKGRWWRPALDMLLKHRNQAQVIDVVEDLPIGAYDAVLSCMADRYEWKEAVRLLRRMEEDSKKKTFGGEDSRFGGKNLKKKGMPMTKPALSTYRIVIECCAASQQTEQAVQVLQSCVKHGLTPTVYSFELVISTLSKKLQWRRALQLLDMMDELNVPKTLVCYNSVLSAMSRAREVVQAKNLLVRMRKNPHVQPNIISYNTVLAATASTSRWKDALSILDQCHREPLVTPDIYTYTNAIRACAKGGKTQRALTLLQVVKDKQLPIDGYCYTAAIEACAKAKMWKEALKLLDEMEERGIEPNEVTYSVTITACGNGGQWQKALDLLDLMREKKLRINLITYNSAITAVSKAAKHAAKVGSNEGPLWPTVKKLLDQMHSDGMEPDGFSYASAMSCCGAEGRWREALHLLELMEQGGPRTRPNKIAYSAAISSCGKAGKAEEAMRLFRQMKDQGIAADLIAYNALFSALRVSHKADAAYELWGEMAGHRQSNTDAIATARADRFTSPDIVTITNAIAAMTTDANTPEERKRVDLVFSEAVKRGIILRSDTLDSDWEVDLSGMSLPVARAACRYVLQRILATARKGHKSEEQDLTFITGVGRGMRRAPQGKEGSSIDDSHPASLREYVQQVLTSDFDPPLISHVPDRALGTVEVRHDVVKEWIARHK